MLSHRQGLTPALVRFVLPCLFLAATANDAPLPTYHTGASEVRISFFATDENNRTVDTVTKDDFAVVDGGLVIRDFRSLTRSNETVLDVVAVVDASESVAGRFRQARDGVLQLLSEESLAGNDSISVVSFSGLRPSLLCARDCRSAGAEQRLLEVKASGSTPLFDALAYAASLSANRQTPGARQILILFSDGNDTISMTSARQALEAIIASGALLYTVDLNEPGDLSGGSALLQAMAEASGGRSFSFHEGTVNVLQAALADLRASYVVTYPLPNRLGGLHSLRILPKHNLNLRFHCRGGYYYESSVR